MKTILIDCATHRGEHVVLIKFPIDKELGIIVRKIENIRWSNTHKAWYALYSIALLNEIKTLFSPVCTIDARLLKEKIAKEKQKETTVATPALTDDAKHKIEKYKQFLRSRRYSESTIKTYTDALQSFLKFYWNKNISEINNNDVIVFNNEFIIKNKLSASYQNQVVNAIKLFFRTVQNTAINAEIIHRSKRPKLLPNVLSKEEVKLILNAHSNIKHKTMLN